MTEIVNKIVLNQDNELVLMIVGKGNPSYQYVYREAAGVYWDESQRGFKSTPLREWTVSEWFAHIREIVKNGLNVDLEIVDDITWENISSTEQEKIKNMLQHRS